MARLLLKALVFALPIVTLFGVAEHKLESMPTGYSTLRGRADQHIGPARVIVTGSSHAYYGIKPQILGSQTFSLAYISQDIYYDTRLVLKYLSETRDLSLVIVPISYISFGNSLDDSIEAWRTPYYYHFFRIPHQSGWPQVEDYSLIALYGIPQVRAFAWNGFAPDTSTHLGEFGGSADIFISRPDAVRDAGATLARHRAAYRPVHVEQNDGYLRQLFSALQSRGIAAVITTTPCFRSYSDHMEPDLYAIMQNHIRRLLDDYGLEYFNYLTDARFTIEDFMDSDHLSTQGAIKFSEILKAEVVR